MRRTSFRWLATGLALSLIVMFTAGAQMARAQQDPNCCDYIINSTHIPAACFPLAVVTNWAGGFSATVTLTAPGFASFHVPFACPPAPPFQNAVVAAAAPCCMRPASYFCGGCLFIELVPC